MKPTCLEYEIVIAMHNFVNLQLKVYSSERTTPMIWGHFGSFLYMFNWICCRALTYGGIIPRYCGCIIGFIPGPIGCGGSLLRPRRHRWLWLWRVRRLRVGTFSRSWIAATGHPGTWLWLVGVGLWLLLEGTASSSLPPTLHIYMGQT